MPERARSLRLPDLVVPVKKYRAVAHTVLILYIVQVKSPAPCVQYSELVLTTFARFGDIQGAKAVFPEGWRISAARILGKASACGGKSSCKNPTLPNFRVTCNDGRPSAQIARCSKSWANAGWR